MSKLREAVLFFGVCIFFTGVIGLLATFGSIIPWVKFWLAVLEGNEFAIALMFFVTAGVGVAIIAAAVPGLRHSSSVPAPPTLDDALDRERNSWPI